MITPTRTRSSHALRSRSFSRSLLLDLLILVGIPLLTSTTPAVAQHKHAISEEFVDGAPVVANEVIVKFRPNAALGAIAEVEQGEDIDATEAIGDGRAMLFHSRSRDTAALLRSLRRRPDVEYVEPNFFAQAALVPNDPHFGSLWAMQNTGQTVNNHTGTPGADIKATLAWDVTIGSAANVVTVVDSGIDYKHPDLAANIWTAPRRFKVRIGHMTVWCPAGSHGFNALTNTCDPMDDNNHGTHVSGTIGAVGNDGVGIVGVNWTASIMGSKFLDAGGNGTAANAINAIEFAIQARQELGPDANVRVLSNSWVLTGPSQALLDEINKADLNEMLFVVAAGNNASNNDTTPLYPQSYATPNMITVAATTQVDSLAGFSNYGPMTVHLGAPGFDIVSTIRNGLYAFENGTSMAAPHVAGTAALMLAVNGALTVADLKAGILNNVDPLSDLAGRTVTGGRLNANRAVRSVVSFTISALPTSLSVKRNSSGTYSVQVGALDGFADPVLLSVAGLPANCSATFVPPAVTGSGTSELTIQTQVDTPKGTFPLSIDGTSGAVSHSAAVTLTVK